MQTARRKTLLVVAAALLLVAALYTVSSRTRPPLLPDDDAHRTVATNAGCSPCHGAGAPHPLSPKHPPKEDCLLCHRPGR